MLSWSFCSKYIFYPFNGLTLQSGCFSSLLLQLSHYCPPARLPLPAQILERFPSIFYLASAFASINSILHPPPPPRLGSGDQLHAQAPDSKFSNAPSYSSTPSPNPFLASSRPPRFLSLSGPASTPLPFLGSAAGLGTDPGLLRTVL